MSTIHQQRDFYNQIAQHMTHQLNLLSNPISLLQQKKYEHVSPKSPEFAAELEKVLQVYRSKIDELLLLGARITSWKSTLTQQISTFIDNDQLYLLLPILQEIGELMQNFQTKFSELAPHEAHILDLIDPNTKLVISSELPRN